MPRSPALRAEQELVAKYTKDFRRLQRQKMRTHGGVESRILMNLAMYFGEQYAQQSDGGFLARPPIQDEDKNKLFLVLNVIKKLTNRKMGRIWSIANEFRAIPDTSDPVAFDLAEEVNKLIRATDEKLLERQQHWKRLFWLLLGGVVIEHTPWELDVSMEPMPVFAGEDGSLVWVDGQTKQDVTEQDVMAAVQAGAPRERFSPKEELQLVGDVGSQIISPLNFFIDAAIPTIDQLPPDQACYIAEIKTKGWIKANFGEDVADRIGKNNSLSIVGTRLIDRGGHPTAGLNIRDLIPAVQGAQGDDDPDMVIVCTRYMPVSKENPHGHCCRFVPDGPLLDPDSQESPYEGGEIPLTDIHWGAPTVSFWSDDFITDQIPAQKFLNKRFSQLGEASNGQLYEILLLGGELSAADIPTDFHGVVEDGLDENGTPRVAALQRGQLPSWFLDSIRIVVEYLESVGGSDLMAQKKFPGQLRGSLSVPMLQEILDSEDGPRFEHLGEQLARVRQHRVNRVKQFYEPIRTMNYTGKNQRDEVLVFHTQKVLHSKANFNITVDRSTLVPELAALREARVRERLESPIGIIYTNRRTGRLDASKIAADLKWRDSDREDRETQYRKLAKQFIGRLWQGEPVLPSNVLPFFDHDSMMDELEAAMATTEFLDASQIVRQNFLNLYEAHRTYLQQLQDAQAQAIEGAQMHSAVAQATQQAAAKVAAQTVDETLMQIKAQEDMARVNPIGPQIVQAQMESRQRQLRAPQPVRLGPNGQPAPGAPVQ